MVKNIPMNQGKFVFVDDEDYDYLMQWRWTFNPHGGGYASRTDRTGVKQKTVLMHRQIMDASRNQIVDHINRDRLDNRRVNLRVCTPLENARNAGKRKDGLTSNYKGVFFIDRNGKFGSAIQVSGRRISLGYYDNEMDAAYYYNQKAIEYFGEFAALNELPIGYTPLSDFSPDNVRGDYSKYRGVTYDKRDGKYIAQIQYDGGKRKRIGAFLTERVAAEMYNVYALELHGEKAILNTFEQNEGLIKK